MEVLLQKPALKEERRAEFRKEDDMEIVKVSNGFSSETSAGDTPSRPASYAKDPTKLSQEEQLESAKAEMGKVREENERLKTILARIVKDYQSLQMQFFGVLQQEQAKQPAETMSPVHDDEEEPELVSLSLGTSSSIPHKKEEKININKARGINDQKFEEGRTLAHKKEEKIKINKAKEINDQKFDEEGLTLGLDCTFEGSTNSLNYETVSNHSQDNSCEEPKEEEPGEAWPPSKILKSLRNGDDEISHQPQVKKARVSVRARCDASTMNDGCQWRKYGQKIAKGNPCPRAYYRCTVAPACPVRKQVQRCAEDMSILITTYEGTHSHPLPISATAMASTTSAAASMLMSGSSASRPGNVGHLNSSITTAAAAATLASGNHGLNFSLSDNSRPRPFYLPNTSISSTPSYPTITLDLTSQPPSSFSSPANQFSKFSSSFAAASRFSSTNLSFSSSESAMAPATSTWNNGSYLNYGTQPYNKSSVINPLNLGKQAQDSFYHSYIQKAANPNATSPPLPNHQNSLTDTIAKAITSDPSFQSVIAAAITSYVGAHGSQSSGGDSHGHGHGLKWGERLNSVPPSFAATPNGNACATSFLNRSTTAANSSSSNQQGSLLFLQPSLGFPSSKSGTASSPPDHNREKTTATTTTATTDGCGL